MIKKVCFLFILPVFLASCFDKRIKSPEQVDLIYLDIQSDIKKTEGVIKLRETEIQTVRGEMQSLPPRSKSILVKQMRIENMEKDVERFEQFKKYLSIKLKKRKQMAKIRYELKFQENKEWPDKKEYADYLIVKNHSQMPVKEINKSDNSRSSSHKKDVGKILKDNGF